MVCNATRKFTRKNSKSGIPLKIDQQGLKAHFQFYEQEDTRRVWGKSRQIDIRITTDKPIIKKPEPPKRVKETGLVW